VNPKRKYSELSRREKDELNAKKRARRKRKRMKEIVPDVPSYVEPDYDSILHKLQVDLGRPLRSPEVDAIKSNVRREHFIIMFFRYNCNVSAACISTGISRGTYYQWLERYPEFREAVTEANEALLDFAEEQLIKNIKAGKETSLFFYLCNKGKHRGWESINRMSGPKIKSLKFTLIDANTDKRPTRKRIASTVSGDQAVSISAEESKEN